MAKLPPDLDRRTEIEANGGVIYSSPPGWPQPAALFTPDVLRRILDKTGKPLQVPSKMQPLFCQKVAQTCRLYAFDAQLDHAVGPSASEVRTARAAVERLKVAMTPMLGQHPDEMEITVYASLPMLVQRWDAEFIRRPAKPKHTAARNFIRDIGCIFAAAFDSVPSTAPDGPFARFVLACLDEMQGLPETVSGNWVQKYVREYKTASQGNDNLWALNECLAWDDPP